MNAVWFGARLSLRRGATTRLSSMVSAVAMTVGIAVILVVAAVPGAMDARAARAGDRAPIHAPEAQAKGLPDEATDIWHGRTVTRVVVALTDPSAKPPAGVARLPGPGEIVVSPALASAIDEDHDGELAGRFRGTRIGVIAPPGLLQPDELLVYVGTTPDQVRTAELGFERFAGFGRDDFATGGDENAMRTDAQTASAMVALLLVALFVLLIVLTLRLAANARAARVAAFRLVGGSVRQSRKLLAGEVAAASGLGTVGGVALFFALRSGPLAWWSVPWFPADLALGWVAILTIIGLPVIAQASAQIGSRAALQDAFATRRRRPAAFAALPRLVAAASSVALLVFLVVEPELIAKSLRGQLLLIAVPVFLVSMPMALTVVTAKVAAVVQRRARRLDVQLAAARARYEPARATRAVAAIAAVIIVGAGIANAFTATNLVASGHALAGTDARRALDVELGIGTRGPAIIERLASTPGVEHVALVSNAALKPADPFATNAPWTAMGLGTWIGSCPDVVQAMGHDVSVCAGRRSVRTSWRRTNGRTESSCFLSTCPDAALPLVVDHPAGLPGEAGPPSTAPKTVVHLPATEVVLPWVDGERFGAGSIAAVIDPADHPGLQPATSSHVLVRTDGRPESENRVRAIVLADVPLARVRSLAADTARRELLDGAAASVRTVGSWLAVIPALAACAVAATDTLLDRRALTGSLRSLGVPRTLLWRSMCLFLLAPLGAAAILGLFAAQLLDGATDRFFGRPVTWRPELAVQAVVPTMAAAAVIAGLAWVVACRSSTADAIRRE